MIRIAGFETLGNVVILVSNFESILVELAIIDKCEVPTK